MRPYPIRVCSLLVVTLLMLGGCLFAKRGSSNNNGNGENNDNTATNGATNSSTHNGTNVATNNTTTGTNNQTTTNNMTGVPVESYGEVQVEEIACEESPVLWFDPQQLTGAPLSDDAQVAATAPANLLEGEMFGEMTAGVADVDGGEMTVTLAVVEGTSSEGATEPILWGTSSIPMEGEVLNVVVTGALFTRIATEEPVVAEATVATTAGVWECDLVELMMGEPDGRLDCIPSPLEDELGDLVDQPERVDFAPVFDDDPSTGDWLWKLTESPIISVVSGGAENERLGIVRADVATDGEVSVLERPAELSVPAEQGEIYAERIVWGVDTASFGWPSILLLGRVEGGDYGPWWLKASSTRGEFTRDEDLNWRLSDLLNPQRGTFSFVDGYALDGPPEFQLVGFTFAIPPGKWNIGYTGIADGGLVFSRPDGFSGLQTEFVQLEGSFDEVAAYRNVPLAELATGEPLVVVIGEGRTTLGLINWDFDDRVDLVDNVLSDEWTDVRQLSVGVLYSDSGVIGFRGRKEGTILIGGAPVANVSNLRTTCP